MYSCNYKNEYLGEGGFPDAFRGVHVKFPLAKKNQVGTTDSNGIFLMLIMFLCFLMWGFPCSKHEEVFGQNKLSF